MKIKAIHGYEVIDSRGNPTVGARVVLDDGSYGLAFVPEMTLTTTGTSGAATFNSTSQVLNIPQYTSATGAAFHFTTLVPFLFSFFI